MTFKCIIVRPACTDCNLPLEKHAIEYPDYQNHEELDIEIEKTEAENECSKSNSKISIASADSGHQPSDQETDHHHVTKMERKGNYAITSGRQMYQSSGA